MVANLQQTLIILTQADESGILQPTGQRRAVVNGKGEEVQQERTTLDFMKHWWSSASIIGPKKKKELKEDARASEGLKRKRKWNVLIGRYVNNLYCIRKSHKPRQKKQKDPTK